MENKEIPPYRKAIYSDRHGRYLTEHEHFRYSLARHYLAEEIKYGVYDGFDDEILSGDAFEVGVRERELVEQYRIARLVMRAEERKKRMICKK